MARRRGVEATGRGLTELRRTWVRLSRLGVTGLASHLVTDPVYLETLQTRLRAGKCHPAVESLLYYYAYGKPKELVEVKRTATVRIVHEYADKPSQPVDAEVVEVKALGPA